MKAFDRPKIDSKEQEHSKAAKHMAKKIRRFQNVSEIIRFIGETISDMEILDFGPMLKGQDYEDKGVILKGNFY